MYITKKGGVIILVYTVTFSEFEGVATITDKSPDKLYYKVMGVELIR